MSREQKPRPMPPSQAKPDTKIGAFTKMSVSNSDADLHLVLVTNAGLNGRILVIPEAVFSPVRTDPVWGRAQYGLVQPEGHTGPDHQ